MFASYSTYHNHLLALIILILPKTDGLLLENSRSIFVLTVLIIAYVSPQNTCTYCERGGRRWGTPDLLIPDSCFLTILLIITLLTLIIIPKGTGDFWGIQEPCLLFILLIIIML